MADASATLGELRALVTDFTAARDWARYHNAKDLALSIVLEASELLEEYQWLNPDQVATAAADPVSRERARQELADVLIYCLCFANALDIDVSEAVQEKLVLSGQKYPPGSVRGRLPGRPR